MLDYVGNLINVISFDCIQWRVHWNLSDLMTDDVRRPLVVSLSYFVSMHVLRVTVIFLVYF